MTRPRPPLAMQKLKPVEAFTGPNGQLYGRKDDAAVAYLLHLVGATSDIDQHRIGGLLRKLIHKRTEVIAMLKEFDH